METRALLFLSMLLLLATWQITNCSAADTKVSTQEQQETEIRKVLFGLSEAASAGNVDGITSIFSEDAVLIDDSGEETRGRKALQERFANTVKQRNGAGSVVLHPGKISLPAPNVAIVVGEVSRKDGDLDLPATRFSMVLVKQSNGWLINEATETQMQSIKAADHLKELNWLIGNWQVNKSDGGTTRLKVDWANDKNFIHSKCINSKPGSADRVDDQIIGWDPRTSSIVSWHFDCNGGFGYGKWTREAKQWVVEFAGVGANGDDVRASNVFSIKGPDEFDWQSRSQTDDGVQLADMEPVKVMRARP